MQNESQRAADMDWASSARPPGQKVETLFVWTGGARPGGEAVFGCRLQLHNGRKTVGEFGLGTRRVEAEEEEGNLKREDLLLITSLTEPGLMNPELCC